jgi:O-antigen ligase
MSKISQHKTLELRDFIPKIPCTLTLPPGEKRSRLKMWRKAVELWRESPWFGIGLGQYNIVSSFGWKHTAHNLYLSILCEGGIFAFLSWIVLMYRFCKQWWSSYMMAVVVTIAVASCFENLFTGSFAWILTCSWIFAHASQKQSVTVAKTY